jgi:hypothetical protein
VVPASNRPGRRRALIAGPILILLGAAVFGGAWWSLPRAVERAKRAVWDVPQYALAFKVRDQGEGGAAGQGVLVPVAEAGWADAGADGLYIGEMYFDTHDRGVPPGFGWLWGVRSVRIETVHGQWIMTADQSPEQLPADWRSQMEAIVTHEIDDGRFDAWEREFPGSVDRLRALVTPVRASYRGERFRRAMPEYSASVPAWRLWLTSVLSGLSLLLGGLGVGCLIRAAVGWGVARSRGQQGRYVDCGYDVRDSPGRCPECGASTTRWANRSR